MWRSKMIKGLVVILLIILSLFTEVSGVASIVFDKSNIGKIDISPNLITDGKQVYFIQIENFPIKQDLKEKLIELTGSNIENIGKNLLRLELNEAQIRRKLFENILNTSNVVTIIPNATITLNPRTKTSTGGNKNSSIAPSGFYHLKNSSYRIDPDYQGQWALENNEGGVDIGALHAWPVSEGLNDGVVAIFGGSINLSHEDLQDSYWTNIQEIPNNGIDDDNNGFIDDIHGINVFNNTGNIQSNNSNVVTGLAGIISAKQDNQKGIAGLSKNDKILTCYMFEPGIDTTFDEIAECFNYIIDLKENRNVNIHSVLLTWGIYALDEDTFPQIRALVDSLIDYNIFIIAPVKHCSNCIGLDAYPEIPASYDSPNIIAVTSVDHTNHLTFWPHASLTPSYGGRTVHTAAPGTAILTTLNGYVPNFSSENAIFYENFDSEPLEQWEQIDDNFSITNTDGFEGGGSLLIQKNSNVEESIFLSKPINLVEHRGKKLSFTFMYRLAIEGEYTPVTVELIYGDGTVEHGRILYGNQQDYWRKYITHVTESFGNDPDDIKSDEALSSVQIKLILRYHMGESVEMYFDNLALGAVEESTVSNKYDYLHGTTAAGAHVAGAISLIKQARPELSMSQIKNLIISTGTKMEDEIIPDGTRKPSYTLNNSTLKIASQDDNSVLTCNDKRLTHRVYPKQKGEGHFVSVVGFPEKLAVYNVNCSEPAGAPDIFKDGVPIETADDGLGLDTAKSDGIYTASIVNDKVGHSEIIIDSDEYGDYKYRAFTPYLPAEIVDYEWEEPVEGSTEVLNSSTEASPFPFNIGNIKDDHQLDSQEYSVNMDQNGFLTIRYLLHSNVNPLLKNKKNSSNKTGKDMPITQKAGSERFLPLALVPWEIKVSPFFRLTQQVEVSKPVYKTFYIGDAPNRKWVLEWMNKKEQGCTDQPEQIFQAVFHETTGKIQFNYKSVGVSCNEFQPAVGLQFGKNFNVSYSDVITDNTSIKFVLPHSNAIYINQTPRLIERIRQIRLRQKEYKEVVLSDHFSDDVPETVVYTLFYDIEKTQPVIIEGVTLAGGLLTFDTREIVEFTNVYIFATDEEGLEAMDQFYLNIDGQSPYVTNSIGDLTASTGETVELDLNDNFSDNLDTNLNYSVDLPTDFYTIEGSIFRINISSAGLFNFIVTATDGDNLSSYLHASIEVVENTPPYIVTGIRDITVEAGNSIGIELNDFFKDDQDNTLVYSIENLPSGLTLNGSVISGSISSAGTYTFTATAQDSTGASISTTGKIIVMAAPVVNQPSKSNGGGSSETGFLMLLIIIFGYGRLSKIFLLLYRLYN